jgi:NADPH-dependent 7-cyano-7-deazaguanine reductase QueF
MSRIYLKQLIKEVIQEIEISKDDIEIEHDPSFEEYAYEHLDPKSIEIDGNLNGYPDFTDIYISYAEWENGTELTDDELDELNGTSYGIELAYDYAFDRYS